MSLVGQLRALELAAEAGSYFGQLLADKSRDDGVINPEVG